MRIGNPGERALKVVVRGGVIIVAGLSDIVISHEYVKISNHLILTEARPELFKILVEDLRAGLAASNLDHQARIFNAIKEYQQMGFSLKEAVDLAHNDISSLKQSSLELKDLTDIMAKAALKIPLVEKPVYGFVTDSLLKNIPQALDNIGDIFKDAGSKFK